MSINQIFIAPALANLRIRSPSDPTWGRYLLPISKYEVRLENTSEKGDGDVIIRRRRVFLGKKGKILEGEDVEVKASEVEAGRGRKWVFYTVWESKKGADGPGKGCDVIICHGE